MGTSARAINAAYVAGHGVEPGALEELAAPWQGDPTPACVPLRPAPSPAGDRRPPAVPVPEREPAALDRATSPLPLPRGEPSGGLPKPVIWSGRFERKTAFEPDDPHLGEVAVFVSPSLARLRKCGSVYPVSSTSTASAAVVEPSTIRSTASLLNENHDRRQRLRISGCQPSTLAPA